MSEKVEIKLFKPFGPPIGKFEMKNDLVKEITILPISEVLLNDINISNFKNNYRKNFGNISTNDELFQSISEGIRYPGLEHWLSFFYPKKFVLNTPNRDIIIILIYYTVVIRI